MGAHRPPRGMGVVEPSELSSDDPLAAAGAGAACRVGLPEAAPAAARSFRKRWRGRGTLLVIS